jgi:hypothetical protein
VALSAASATWAVLWALADLPRASVHTPFYVYLVCYRVLAANHDLCAAVVLQTARQRLHAAAAQLDDVQRRSFLEHVTTHRDLLRCAGC